ncbi:MAG: cation transporter [Oscillospiraceae bacterium]
MKKVIKLQDLDCANCAAKMEDAIAKLAGVNSVNVNFMRQSLTLDAADEQFDSVLESAKKVAKKIEPDVRFL